MFKSIEYKLVIYLLLLITVVAGATYFLIEKEYVYAGACIIGILFFISRLYKNYNKFNKNILFLLNALDNGDYSFNFTEAKLSRREKELNQMMNSIKDILTRARKEIIENEKFLSLIVESVSTGIIILDENNNVKITNKATNELLGLPVFTHINQLKVIDESFPQLFTNIRKEDNIQIKIPNEREEMELSLRASIITMKTGKMKIITLNNIGNELEAKEMESWVRLIRVMTHEIMNSIAPITSLTDTLLFAYKMSEEESISEELKQDTTDALETISHTAKGLINFVQSYRKFTGVPKPNKTEVELKPLLESILRLEIKGAEVNNIESEIIIEDVSTVYADESQITQVLVNLVKNAVEAIGTEKEGKISVKVSAGTGKTHIDVCNNGEPIPEEIAPHIFIPFFSTKDRGSGIGLSISRYIMRLHGGNLKHHTKDEYTVFSMVL